MAVGPTEMVENDSLFVLTYIISNRLDWSNSLRLELLSERQTVAGNSQ